MLLTYMEASAFVIVSPSFIQGFPLICPPSVELQAGFGEVMEN